LKIYLAQKRALRVPKSVVPSVVKKIGARKIDTKMIEKISNKLAGPNKQNQTRPIQLFNIHFVLICTTNKNFVYCAVLEKIVALLA